MPVRNRGLPDLRT